MEEPAKAQVQRFVQFYTMNRDIDKAAQLAGLKRDEGRRIFRDERVRRDIDRRISMIELESAKLEAKARMLTVNVLDGALMEEIQSKKNGNVRVRAIELGYRRTGMIREGEFYVAQASADAEKSGPSIYRALQTTTVRRTLTEEYTQQNAIEAPAEQPASLPEPTDGRHKVYEY